jgi:hypothetical protein
MQDWAWLQRFDETSGRDACASGPDVNVALWVQMDGAREGLQRNHMIMSEGRENTVAVDKQVDVRLLRIDAVDVGA